MNHLRIMGVSAAAVAMSVAFATTAQAAGFYEGKTINVIIPSGAGGGLTLTARTFMNTYEKYIEGNPTIVIRNMPGGTKGHNFLAEKAKPDGTTLLWGSLRFSRVISGARGVRYDPGTFEVIGTASSNFVTVIRADTPPEIKTATDLVKTKRLLYGGSSPGSIPLVIGRLSLDALGVKYRPVLGYRGQAKQSAAIRRKEIQALTTGEVGYYAIYRETIVKDGTLVPAYYHSPFDAAGNPIRFDRYPAKIKHFVDYYKQVVGKEPSGPAWEAYKWVSTYETWPFALVAPAGTPKAAVAALRKAHARVPNDAAFKAQWIKQFGALPKFLSGEEAQTFLRRYTKISPEVLAYLKKTFAVKRGKKGKRRKK